VKRRSIVLCLLRKSLHSSLSSTLTGVFPYAGGHVARITEAVLERLGLSEQVDD
jgi:RNA polymerase sigma-70 factor, ECF subfamily